MVAVDMRLKRESALASLVARFSYAVRWILASSRIILPSPSSKNRKYTGRWMTYDVHYQYWYYGYQVPVQPASVQTATSGALSQPKRNLRGNFKNNEASAEPAEDMKLRRIESIITLLRYRTYVPVA
jgi:hypothetical protein